MSKITKPCISGLSSKLTAILGTQWGDEGKGKLIDNISSKYDIIARFNAGPNSAHKITKNGNEYICRSLPCGVTHPHTFNFIGNSCVVNFKQLFTQIEQLSTEDPSIKERIFISDKAHILTKYHLNQEQIFEKNLGLGTTNQGIGPCYASKALRFGLRIADLKDWNLFTTRYETMARFYNQNVNYVELEEFKRYRELLFSSDMVVDGARWVGNKLNSGARVLAEGANGGLLDNELGTYPYVAAHSTNLGAIGNGLGISPRKIETVIGVVKAYTTRVEEGPFYSQLSDSIGQTIRQVGKQYGLVTGRARRCGWLDLNIVKYTAAFNDYDSLNITKLDVLDDFDEIKVAVEYKLDGERIYMPPQSIFQFNRVQTTYETFKGWKKNTSNIKKKQDLPKQALDYLKFIQQYTKVPISWVGVGPGSQSMIRMIE